MTSSIPDTNTPPPRRPLWLALRTWSEFLRPYRKAVFFAGCALLFTAGITLSLGQGIRLLIDHGFAEASAEKLTHYLMLFAGLVVALAIGTYTRYYWVSWIGERVVADLRARTFSHLIELQPAFFEQNRGLEIQTRLTADTTLLQSVIGSSASMALRNLIMLIGGIIWLFITNAKLTSIVLFSVPLVVFPILLFGRRVRRLSRSSQDSVADVGSYVGEVLGQIKTVQAFNHQRHDREQFQTHVENAFDTARERIVQRGLLIAVVIILVLGAVAFMLWVGGQDVIAGRISGGELAAFVFYSILVGSAVGSISEVIGELQRAAGATDRIRELLAARSPIQRPAMPKTLPDPCAGHITIENLGFAYPARPEHRAIDGLSLRVSPGETLALVGPSGAGKSTLFELLLRFHDPDEGHIFLEGIDLRELDPAELRRQFALVSQEPSLFHGSIYHNLKYARPEAGSEEVHLAARTAHADEFIERLPQGYDTKLGDLGIGLSGGQKQRLAIARALLSPAPILLLDEATSALDARSEQLVQSALDRLMEGRTTLVIAHRLSTVINADRIAVMNMGRIEAIGRHEELLQSNPLYAELAKLQLDRTPSTNTATKEHS